MTRRDDLLTALATLFEETGNAHKQAFLGTEPDDEERAAWYAHYAHDRLEALLDIDLPEGELTELLEAIEEQRSAEPRDRAWPDYYAEAFAERFFDD